MNQGICPPVLSEMNISTKQRYQSLVSAYLKSQTDYIPLKNLNDAHVLYIIIYCFIHYFIHLLGMYFIIER